MSARNMAKRTAAGTLALAVCLGGGALALAGAAQADANFKFDSRIAGDDRYETAIAASKAAFPTDGSSENVILVNGYATVDGLTASYLAGVAKAPILYVSDKGADAKTQAEIKRLGVKNVWLVGGTTVIPQSVEDAIKVDYKVTRINGGDRYETAKLIAEAGAKISGKQPSKVFVASGTSFADALAVSPVAYAKGYAIALTEKDSTSEHTKAELKAIGTDTKILVGGTSVVSDSVKSDLGVSTRVAGDDRAVTANLVSDWAKKSEGFNPAQAALVGGTNGNGADSLVASSVLGKSLTTLHFAGWDATNVYLKDHSAELTGKGVVFGGKAAVNDDQVSKAQAAAQTVAAGVSFIVTSYTAGATSFQYADPSAKKAVKATFSSSDKYMVGGVSATQGAFAAALTAGDVVAITPAASSGGAVTYSLTNKTSADYMKGLVGAVDTASGAGHHNLSIVEPVVGATVNGGIDYTGSYTVFTVDGATVSQTIFESSINVGDMVAISGTGVDASHIRTIALTNASVTGTISDITANAITVKTAAGAALGTFTPAASGDTLTIDGAVSTLAVFQATATGATVGDNITISKSGGVQTFALINSAPSSVSGVVNSSSTSTDLHYWGSAGVDKTVTYGSLTSATYVVDGKVASQGEFAAAVTPGDLVTYQAADTATKTTASLSLTSKPLAGSVSAASSTAHTMSVSNDDNDVLQGTIDYTSKTSVYAAGTSLAYTVDGATQTQAQFDVAVGRIASGATQGTVAVSVKDGVVTWALATTAWTAAPAMVSATNPHSTSVVVKLNKPVSATSAAAAGDFTVTVAGVSNTVTNVALTDSKTITITITSASTALDSVVITPTTTGAAKYVDAYGTALPTSSLTITAS